MRPSAILLPILLTAIPAFAADCDRACLTEKLDFYLSAVVDHDPTAAPLSVGFRETENAIAQRAGSGVWQSANALGKLDRRYYDPVTGQAGYFGIIEEDAGMAIATLRLKVEDDQITEAEWVISRFDAPGIGPGAGGQADHAYHDPDYLLAHPPPPVTIVEPSQRLSRTDLIAVTNSYFDGLSARTGKLIIANPGCVRVENGFSTTQRPLEGGGQSDCTSEGAMRNIFAVTDRRYPVVDEEAQAVWGW